MKNGPRVLPFLLVAAAFVPLVPPPAGAETDLRADGQVRVRAEADRRAFGTDTATLQYSDLRTRIGIRAVRDGNATVLVQLQDSRRLGGLDADGQPVSGTLVNGRNVDVHQAFIRIDRIGFECLGLQAGRFELSLGNQRVFGAVGWDNVGRSWEGVSLQCAAPGLRSTAYKLKRIERNDSEGNRDSDVYGLYGELPELGLDVFGFFERDAERSESRVGESTNRLERLDWGVYFRRDFGPATIEMNGVYQTGDRLGEGESGDREEDISAYLATAELAYRFEGRRGLRVAAGVDYASGDSDPNDGRYRAYDNLYYTGHKFRGFMDYFLASGSNGLVDLLVRISVEPAALWTFRADIHHFRTERGFTGFEGEGASSLGDEIDLTTSTTRIAGVLVEGGASLFLPTDAFAGTGEARRGVWAFASMTVDFGGEI